MSRISGSSNQPTTSFNTQQATQSQQSEAEQASAVVSPEVTAEERSAAENQVGASTLAALNKPVTAEDIIDALNALVKPGDALISNAGSQVADVYITIKKEFAA